MQEQESLRSAFEAMAERYGADRWQAKTQEQLSVIHETVKAFQAEGFPVSLEVRPEHTRCGVVFPEQSQPTSFFGNGTIKVGETTIEFAFGQRSWEQMLAFAASWDGTTVMRRDYVYDDAKKSWRDVPQQTYPYSGMDGPALKGAASDGLRHALSTLLLHVLVKGELAARFNDDRNALDKPASRLPSVKPLTGP